jgi:hypothetical protein
MALDLEVIGLRVLQGHLDATFMPPMLISSNTPFHNRVLIILTIHLHLPTTAPTTSIVIVIIVVVWIPTTRSVPSPSPLTIATSTPPSIIAVLVLLLVVIEVVAEPCKGAKEGENNARCPIEAGFALFDRRAAAGWRLAMGLTMAPGRL